MSRLLGVGSRRRAKSSRELTEPTGLAESSRSLLAVERVQTGFDAGIGFSRPA